MIIEKLLNQAQQKCQQAGGRFTDKRKDLLKILIEAGQPLSAYELADAYNASGEHKIQPMSAYRMLDFFVEMDLVHKLASTNKYVVCSHLACEHNHRAQYFVLCKSCGAAQEISMNEPLKRQISESVSSVGFQLVDSQFELYGICDTCANNA